MGHTGLVKTLIEAGSDMNHQDERGRTALVRAVKNDYIETVFLLLMKGADASIQDVYGKTALDYAQERGCQESVKLLLLTEKFNQEQKQDSFSKEKLQDLFLNEKGEVFGTLKMQGKQKIYQLKTDGKEIYLKQVELKKSTPLQKILKDVLIKNLMHQKEE